MTQGDEQFRLYAREWGIVHTAMGVDGLSAMDLSRKWVNENIAGAALKANRVRHQLRVVDKYHITASAEVLINYFKGDFATLHLAESFATVRGFGEYVIARAGSAEDNELSASVWLPYD